MSNSKLARFVVSAEMDPAEIFLAETAEVGWFRLKQAARDCPRGGWAWSKAPVAPLFYGLTCLG